jgi:carboxymethylenebutenolidase
METSSEMIRVTTPDGNMPALLAVPKGTGKHPAVIVVMEAFGLNGHIKDVANRIASEGYVVLAPDMYYREGSPVAAYDDLPEAIRLMSGLKDDGIVRDIGAAIGYLRSHGAADPDRIGITGFCMGGRISFLAACKNNGIKASVPFYGGGIGGLLGEADKLSCPTLLFFGDKDAFIPKDEVEKVASTLKKLGKPAEVKVYPGAEHGFFCNERASYNPEAAKDAWKRLTAFFAQHLGS